MQVSEMFTSCPRFALAHRHLRNHDIAIVEAGFDDGFGAQQPRHFDGRDGGDVVRPAGAPNLSIDFIFYPIGVRSKL